VSEIKLETSPEHASMTEPDSSGPKVSRRKAIASLGGLVLVATGFDATFVETRRHQVSQHRLGRPDATGPTLRMVQLSDLHLRGVGGHEEAIAESVAELRPDVILFTGDSIDRQDNMSHLGDFLGLLDRRAPMYAILGNWERWASVDLSQLRETFESADCHLLINESVVHEHSGARLLITGLDDLVGGRPDPEAAMSGAPREPNHLLLAHCPEQRDLLGLAEPAGEGDRAMAPDYILSGHTHGGQVAFFGWAPLRPRGCGPYLAGWYRGGASDMYVSRGLGTSGLPIRFGSVPEVAVFDWRLDLT